MKKVLTLQLHRTVDGESVKDGGPALVREVRKAFERRGYQVDSLSGNSMSESKQHADLSPFFQRIYKAFDFAKELGKTLFNKYDIILFFHPSELMGFEASELPLQKMILFPTLLGKEYEYFMEVPDKYIEMEKKILSYEYVIQCPSYAQARILNEYYKVSKERIFVQPRGFSPKLFVPRERYLRKDISFEKPVRIISANAIRPQKGYLDLVNFIQFCKKKDLPIRVVIYADTLQSTNKTYLAYSTKFINVVKEQGLQKYFEFHQAIDQELLGAEMANADMAIIPSIYESFGKSALESSASGLPTIVFDDIPAYLEFLSKESAIFCPRTPEGLFNVLSELIYNPEYYHQLSVGGIQNGQKHISNEIYDHLVLTIETKLKIA